MIPTSLFGIDAKECDDFFNSLLMNDPEVSEIEDPTYERMLYDTLELEGYNQIKKINKYIGFKEQDWNEEICQEIISTFRNNQLSRCFNDRELTLY